MENKLKNLNRIELMGNLKSLVKREKELTLEILDYLQEISTRRIFLEMGYSSLFTFLTEELGYCSGTAHLRIQTMNALKVPENRERVLNGKTSLNTLAKAQSFINNENKSLSKQSAPLLTDGEKQELFTAVEGVASSKLEEVLKEKIHEIEVKKSQEQGLPPPEKRILKKFHFEADPELVEMIEEIKNLLSHVCPDRSLADVLKQGLPLAIQEIQIKKGLVKRSEIKQNIKVVVDLKPQREIAETVKSKIEEKKREEVRGGEITSSMKLPNEMQGDDVPWKYKRKITRAIPVELKRKVWKRDGGRCQYQDPTTGKRCESKHQLELDHVKPWSVGGEHSLENLWTLCRNHNVYRWNAVK